jgi:hypothetical protein
MRTGPGVGLAPSVAPSGPPPRAGHTRISAQALTRVVEAITAEVFGVPVQNLKARLRDHQGLLWVSVAVPMAVPPLRQIGRIPDLGGEGSLYDRADANRQRIIDRTRLLTGYVVGRVDIRLMGRPPTQQVRLR